ncbi:TPA: acetyl-CoA carboxylase biotin carboxyl carrier protein subunit [Streptococcus pyogenes]|nr:acetyl-CoA carboxylase biotin carboxyl carrier protein subunit [Streptococcus pyogenes]
MLRKFKITIDGKEYLVEMEEIGAPAQAAAPVQPISTPVPVPTEASPQVEEAQAPQPVAAVGDQVTENQPLLILEAMKMENEIVASSAGTITAIHVGPGQVVNPGDGLITIG